MESLPENTAGTSSPGNSQGRGIVVTNLVKLVDVLPKLNVTADPELERLAAEVRASLLVDPQELRKSESVRNETAKRAMEISERMSAYMYPFPAPTTDDTTDPTTTTITTTTTTTDEGRAA